MSGPTSAGTAPALEGGYHCHACHRFIGLPTA
ncbi:hypothetical protein CGRA01v4_06225 [Colletotrichum graminicola]|nr:hypothetical protein CGRA01v4_06225 [Colletotrichum graminicola]